VAIYEENLNLKQYRDDVVCYPVPFDKLTRRFARGQAAQAGQEHGVRGRGGATAGIDLAVVEKCVRKQFAKKQKVFDLNFGAVRGRLRLCARRRFTKQDPYFIER
jgi:2-oxoglutarate/2-oxoacid ferredoxin oxidoreductase subunit alpha